MKSGYSKIMLIIAVGLVGVLFPLGSSGEAAMKFKYITSIYFDGKGVPLKQPEGVACNNPSLLIVADTGNGRLLRYELQDEKLQPQTVELKSPQLVYPINTKINSNNEIYSLDRRLHRIIKLTPDGKFQGELQPTGLPSPSTFVPRSFALDLNDNIYILDILSERVLVLNPERKYIKHLGFPAGYGFFSDIAVDSKGTILLIDSVQAVVYAATTHSTTFTPITKSLKEYVRFPASLTLDDRGRIYLLDRNGGSFIVLGQEGSFLGRQSRMGWKEGRLNYPAQICMNQNGQVFVADTNNSRVQVFRVVE